jgi:pyridoxamine 5'-phosphate oxidase
VPENPYILFDAWFAEAQASEPNDPNAVALATATPDGRPSVRMVLLKGHDPRGFVIYTNLDSRKGEELAPIRKRRSCFTGRACAGRYGSKDRSRR